MAEALGVASSITAPIQASALLSLAISKTSLTELQLLRIKLYTVEELTDVSTECEPWVAASRQFNDLFKELTELLTGHAKKLTAESLASVEKVTQRLQWTLTKKSVEEI